MPTPIDRDELQRLLAEQQAQLVEVLPAPEYQHEHLPGVINIPLEELNAETARQLKRGQPVIVHAFTAAGRSLLESVLEVEQAAVR
jgi:rhodanese-related sulfurtransferase